MIGLPSALTIHLAIEPVDMRKQFDGLWTVASQVLREDPFGGALFVFTNKRRNRVKWLYGDGTDVWVLAKRLEKGCFTWPRGGDGAKVTLSAEALTMLLGGIDLKDGAKKSVV
ncbi:MAG: IS66 family insertion sequence element accessory protein TnpB [Candidatus Synoicihabitans palmerolidicus]|nr:IS66 family insertion sequence element accessory protein TnpB [Candidatus Synoicihabitans palmerolidicus]